MNKKHKISNKEAKSTVVDEGYLMAYLEGSLTNEQQHELETIIDNDPFLNDAVEGLSYINDRAYLKTITAQINHQLKKQVEERRQTRRKRRKIDDHWAWIAVAIVLILIIMAWWVMHALLKK